MHSSVPTTRSFRFCNPVLIILFTLLGFLGTAKAQTYTTIADGMLNNGAIWSTDGGITPCGCTPVTELSTFFILNMGSMEINHNVFFTKNTIVLGSGIIVNINATGAFAGNRALEVRNGVVNNFGSLSASDLTVTNGGFLNNQDLMSISPGNMNINFQGRLNLAGRTNIPNGNTTNLGTITIRGSATVFVGGRISNDGYIEMEPSACLQVIGNMVNLRDVRLINGPGKAFIQSNSNIENLSFWDINVEYCAGGTVTGLTHPMNCTTCGILPVELVNFEVQLQESDVLLSWETASETGNAFFTIERSKDGANFETWQQVDSDNPEFGKFYQIYDLDPFYGTSWYRLSQTDQNGSTQTLETVIINNSEMSGQHFNAFPNPFSGSIRITTYGLEGAPVTIQVLDLSGRELVQEEVPFTSDFEVYEIHPGNLPTGIYLINIAGNNLSQSIRLIHH